MHVHKKTKTQPYPHSSKCIFIGYSEEFEAYRLLDVMKKHVIISHDVVFEEMEPHIVKRCKNFLPHIAH